MLTQSDLKCLSNGKTTTKVEGFKSDWNEVKLRGIAFYPNINTSSWCASSEEYTLTLDQVQRLQIIFSSLSDGNSRFSKEILSGKGASTDLIEMERDRFLKNTMLKIYRSSSNQLHLDTKQQLLLLKRKLVFQLRSVLIFPY